MGYSLAPQELALPKFLLLIVLLLDFTSFILLTLLYFIGVWPDRPQAVTWSDIIYVFFDVAVQQPDIPSDHAGDQLRVLKFTNMAQKTIPRSDLEDEEAEQTCVVCLGRLKGSDEVRELGNCCHAFHKDCIDKWMGRGRMTCPLCRAQLLPVKPGIPVRQRASGFLPKLR